MAQRPGVQLTAHRPADGGEHPNRYFPTISAHIRVYWPPKATRDEVLQALTDAYLQAGEEIQARGNMASTPN